MWIGPQLTRYCSRACEIKCFDRLRSTNYLERFCCTSAVLNTKTVRIFEAILDRLNLYKTCTSFCKYYFMKGKWIFDNNSNTRRFMGLEMNVANRIRSFMNSTRKSLLCFFLWNRQFHTSSYWLPDIQDEISYIISVLSFLSRSALIWA